MQLLIGCIGPNVNLGVGCVIGAGCQLTIPEQIPDCTIVFGKDCTRKLLSDKPPVSILMNAKNKLRV